MKKTPVLISLFCGAGGLDLGFEQEGYQIGFACDVDGDAVKTYNYNRSGEQAIEADVRDLTAQDVLSALNDYMIPVGVLGGPPCQSFSVSNVHQSEGDHRNDLPLAYASLLSELARQTPISFFVFENVPGLVGQRHEQCYGLFKKRFSRAGFRLAEAVLDASEFGVPQVRRRVFVVGINRDLHPDAEWLPPTGHQAPPTVRSTIGGLREPVYNAPGLDPSSFPEHPNHWCLVPRSSKFLNGSLQGSQALGRSFRTLGWDSPSWTVAYGHREVHVHPAGHRRLSIYEAMLLQTFPKEYQLIGKMTAQIRLVSDAVPPLLARQVAASIRRSLEDS